MVYCAHCMAAAQWKSPAYGLCAVAWLGVSTLLAQAPRIDSLAPNQGPIAGATNVTVSGVNFTGATVTVDNVAVTPSLLAGGAIQFATPKHDNGYAIVRVATPAGTARAVFLYLPPRLEDLPPGYITTVAGVGRYYGDYGPASKALVSPWGLAFGLDGSLYVAENGHNRVVRIRPDGILEPFAGSGVSPDLLADIGDGGPAIDAKVGFPRGIVVESNGDVTIADQEGRRIRRVDARTGTMRTIAGNGNVGFSGDGGPAVNARIDDPTHIAGDGNGTIWFIDYTNGRIRRITPDGKIDTICGTGNFGFSGDGGPATQAQFNLISADFGALAYDPGGFLYLADQDNLRIRRIDVRTGIIDTFIGPDRNFGSELRDLRALTVDSAGDLYFFGEGQIFRVTRDGQLREKLGFPGGPRAVAGTPFAQASLGLTIGITIDSRGNVVYTDATVGQIFRLNRDTGLLDHIAGISPGTLGEDGPPLAATLTVEDVALLPSGEIIFSGDGQRVHKIGRDGRLSVVAGSGSGSGPREDVPATAAPWGGPSLEVDVAGNIFMASPGGLVVQIDTQGIVRRIAGLGIGSSSCPYSGDGGPARQAGLCQPWDAVLDRDGNLIIADTNNNRIRKLDRQTQIITTIAGSGPVNGYENYFLKGTFCGDGGPALQACLNTPFGVAMNADGELLISDQGNGRIRKVDRNGIITTLANLFRRSSYLTTDAAGNVYAAIAPRVLRITPSGAIQKLAGSDVDQAGFGGDGGPATQALVSTTCCGGVSGIAIDVEGNILFTDGGNLRIRAIRLGAVLGPPKARVNPVSGTPQTAPIGTRFADPLAVVILDEAGRPAGNVRIDFATPAQSASCVFPNQQARIGVLTDRNGRAETTCTANTTLGAFSVSATPLGLVASASFALTNTAPRLVFNSVVNAASFQTGPVAPGEIVTIFGAGVGPAQLIQAAPGAGGRFGTELAGVRVRFNGTEAPVLFARFDQVAVVAPYALDGVTSAPVVVEYAGVASNTITVPVAQSSPAIFSADSSGRGQGAILNQDSSVNSAANPADRGSIVALFCTGEGQTDPPGVDGKLASDVYPKPKLPVSVTIGGQPAEILYYGAAPTLVAGVLQINARVPATVAPGAGVPVVLAVGQVNSRLDVTVAIR